MNENKAVVFIMLGQSNAVGHGIPMDECDKIIKPMKNVFGLLRENNQSFDNEELKWSGYTSGGMNLAEEQDHNYSIPNCLAQIWQNEKDKGTALPDLFIVHIAIGAQGVTEKYWPKENAVRKFMWNPEYEKKLISGKLGEVNISLFPFTLHILSMLKSSLLKLGKTDIETYLHWRGGEEDSERAGNVENLPEIEKIYSTLFTGFYSAMGNDVKIKTVLYNFSYPDRAREVDPSGKTFEGSKHINNIFENISCKFPDVSLFDVRKSPYYIPHVRRNGLFIEDCVHYKPEVNQWVSEKIFNGISLDLNNY